VGVVQERHQVTRKVPRPGESPIGDLANHGGQRLIAFGDALHSPIQVEHPEWSCVYDHDPVQAADHRRRLVAELAEPGTIGFGVHFADVAFGQVRRDSDGPTWHAL
jgi:hypothetical protein